MSKSRSKPMSQADKARRAQSPWRGQSIKRGTPRTRPGLSSARSDNAALNRQAVKKMDLSEQLTGKPQSYWDELFAAQRESVRARFGKRAG